VRKQRCGDNGGEVNGATLSLSHMRRMRNLLSELVTQHESVLAGSVETRELLAA